jgi:hypothetical protein
VPLNEAGRNKRSVWEVTTSAYSEAHFATFPPALIEPCILAGCPKGGTVLDPFGGAGTTGLVADRLGRNAILIELNPEYAAMAERRIRGDAGMFAEEVTGKRNALTTNNERLCPMVSDSLGDRIGGGSDEGFSVMSNEEKLRRALAHKTFSIVEPYLSGWRVIVGFNDLREAQDAHCRIEALSATQEQRVPKNPADYGWNELMDGAMDEPYGPTKCAATQEQRLPEEPTEAMLNAARDWSVEKYGRGIGNDAAIGCWKAMRAAAVSSSKSDAPAEKERGTR